MFPESYPLVGRMAGLRPDQIARYEMHRNRQGGDLGHCDPARAHLNRILIGPPDWAARALERIEEIRFANHNIRLDALKRRGRKADLMAAIIKGPADPWRPSDIGPMREIILTANRNWFAADAEAEQRFEATAETWLRTTFGDAVIHARVDHDEAACHIHAVLMPLATKKDGQVMLQPAPPGRTPRRGCSTRCAVRR